MKYVQRKILPCFFSALILISILLASSAARLSAGRRSEIEIDTDIREAAVFTKGDVIVKRIGTISAEKGFYRYIVRGLPWMTDQSSVQVEGSGTADAEIIGIEVEERSINLPTPQEYDALNSKLDSLKLKENSLSIEKDALLKRLEFVSSIMDLSGENAVREIREQSFGVSDWVGMLNFIEGENRTIKQKVSNIEKKLEEIKDQIKDTEQKINQLSFTERGIEVMIDCDVASPGRLEFRISYLIDRGAFWVPGYRVIYDEERETVDLHYQGTVYQRSGEDWNDVSMVLSTAKPHIGASAPELTPAYLKKREPKFYATEMQMPEQVQLDAIHEMRGGYSSKSVKLLQPEAYKSSFAANFSIGSPVSIKTGSNRRILIRREEFPAEAFLYSAPRLSENVFLMGKIVNRMEIPILWGKTGIYIKTGGDGTGSSALTYVGKGKVGSVPAGADFELSLGADQDIEVSHEMTREYLSKEGDRRKEIRYHHIFTAHNFKNVPAELTMKDLVPVSAMDDIDVDDVDIDPEPQSRGEDGIILWKIPLESGEKKELSLEYTVKFPGDWPEHLISNLK